MVPPDSAADRLLSRTGRTVELPMDWEELNAQNRALARAHERLAATGALVRVRRRAAEERLWSDCDLAAFAENRLGQVVDPMSLDGETREQWIRTALDGPLRVPSERKSERCYWIEHDGERAGSFSLSTFSLGGFAYAYSVYLRPAHRGKGIMGRVLRAVHAELERHGLGLKVDTQWAWRSAIGLYLRNGFWLHLWKRDLEFVRRPHVPAPTIAVQKRDASVAIEVGDEPLVLARAQRDASGLVHFDEEPDLAEDFRHLSWDACTTLALAIALAGWPLIRSDRHWQACRHSDAVHPEALAQQIHDWEGYSAGRGW